MGVAEGQQGPGGWAVAQEACQSALREMQPALQLCTLSPTHFTKASTGLFVSPKPNAPLNLQRP